MERRIVTTDLFRTTLSALGRDSATREIVAKLMALARTRPEGASEIVDTGARVWRSKPLGSCPPLQLTYEIHGDEVVLYSIALYDPLLAPPDGSA